jgi:hypothetical protein
MAIDRARAAQHFSTGKLYLPAVDVRAGRGLVAPVEIVVVDRLVEAGRHFDPDMVVLAAGLDHRDGVLARLREAIGQHAARGTGADDDVVELFHFLFSLLSS